MYRQNPKHLSLLENDRRKTVEVEEVSVFGVTNELEKGLVVYRNKRNRGRGYLDRNTNDTRRPPEYNSGGG